MVNTPKTVAPSAIVVAYTFAMEQRNIHSEVSSHGTTVTLNNRGASAVYVDSDPAVNNTTGFKLVAGGKQKFHVGGKEKLYVYGVPPVDVRSAVTR